ncbi:MAG TPA: VWA domain-containing protein [Thermoanaerobaculia bacterium]|nr:VWA domain-containing protein [Thermoanaerobaculia bacterium]
MFRLISSVSLALALVTAATAPPASARNQSRPPDGLFSESFDVQGVNVQVVVTDKKGNRVPGLSAQDFRLLVDGQPVPVEFFLEVRDGRARTVAAPEQGEQAAAADAALPSGVTSGEEVGNSYLIFIDEFFSPVTLRNEALRSLAREVTQLGPEDRVAVVSYNSRKLAVLSDWTAPGEALSRTLRQAADIQYSITTAALRADAVPEGSEPLLENYDGDVGELYGGFSNYLNLRMAERSITAAMAAQRAFAANAPGRKIMILLSGGWNFDRFAAANVDWERAKSMMSVPGTSGLDLLRPLTDTGNLLGYTIYPIHLGNRYASLLPSAGDRDSRTTNTPENEERLIRSFQADVAQSSLVFAAEETGGQMLVPGRNRHLPRIESDTEAYYWLGFTHSGGDNKRRKMTVELLRPGLEARARTSFVPLSREAKTAIEVESALLTGRSLGAKPLEATVGKLEKTGLITAELPLYVKIPTDQVAMVQQGDKYAARLELRVVSLDEDGRQSDVAELPVELSGDSPGAEGGFLAYETRLKVRNIDQDLQVSLYDALSGDNLMTRVRVERPGRK